MENDEFIDHQENDVEVENVIEDMDRDHSNEDQEPVESNERTVPLSALQKERKKRQEAEMNASWQQQQLMRMQQTHQEPEDDSSKYESVTREENAKSQQETVRIIEEKMWIKANPEKYEKLNQYLPEFLKQRPNLASAIDSASNRYEEAYTLMDALTPKQQQKLRTPEPKKNSPNSPSGVPKTVAMNNAVDVMTMNDKEFNEWRNAKRRR